MHVRTPSVGTLGGLQTAPDVAKGPRREWRKPKPVMNGLKKSDAVPGSGRFIRAFHRRLQRLWMRALRRRSQRARFSWEATGAHDRNPVATRLHPPPMAGSAVYRQAPEVGAGWFNDHVRICAGGAQQCAFLPQLRGGGGARRATGVPTATARAPRLTADRGGPAARQRARR